jgi:cation:H+ antiporter
MIPSILVLPAFILGVILLWKGSDVLVEGTSKTAAQLGISTLIISTIIIGCGTSAPEFAVSVGAAIQKNSNISLGNIIGSCIANLLLVLGVASIVRPIKINKAVIKREYPIMLGATFVLLLSSYFGLLDTHHWLGGIFFLILFTIFIVYFIICAKNEKNNNEKIDVGKTQKNIVLMTIGIIGVIVGAWILINSSIIIAEYLGISIFIIAISIVAVGTSVPELVVSSMAAYKKESDIAVGNVLGSNVFNILLIIGFAALFIPLKAINYLDHLLILFGVTFVMFPILFTGNSISRKEGILMLVIYSVFIFYIFFPLS